MTISIVRVASDQNLLGPYFSGGSWYPWMCALKGAFGLPMSLNERQMFKHLAGQREPPKRKVRELWVVGGRRGGKDSIASLIATYAAMNDSVRDRLRPGEKACVLCLAVDRQQAKIVHSYISGYFKQNALLHSLVARETKDGLELANGIEIVIGTSDYRAVRGRTIICAIFDEIAFWASENSVTPGVEVYNAVVPAMQTMPDAILVAISTPYSKRGLLFEKHRKHFGQDDDDVLVIQGSSRDFNPTLDENYIQQQLDADYEAASAEYLAQFRSDISGFLDREVLEAATVRGCYELPPGKHAYVGFADPSGGSGGDSFALAIAYRDGDFGHLACLREFRPPFQPSVVVADICQTLKAYRVGSIQSDKYASGYVSELFANNGIHAEQSAEPKSILYRDFLPIVNSGRARLLDNPRMINQFVQLERRAIRGGSDSIDHPPGPNVHDDLANAAAGAIVLATKGRDFLSTWLACIDKTPQTAKFRFA
jgi:hypothetical protein